MLPWWVDECLADESDSGDSKSAGGTGTDELCDELGLLDLTERAGIAFELGFAEGLMPRSLGSADGLSKGAGEAETGAIYDKRPCSCAMPCFGPRRGESPREDRFAI